MTRPHDLKTQHASTLFLRVPRVDWAAVITGAKTQVRQGPRGGLPRDARPERLPRPIVVHSTSRYRADTETQLMVLECLEQEPLGAITPEGLAAEGYDSLKDFRRYWALRHRSAAFNPLLTVNVYHLALWSDGDRARFGDTLMIALYGDWL